MKIRNVVNEAKRTCVVIISDCEYDVIRKARKVFQANDEIVLRGNPKLVLADQYVGIAKCAPEDTFDEATGLELARERAYRQYNREYNKAITRIIDKLEDTACKLDTLYK